MALERSLCSLILGDEQKHSENLVKWILELPRTLQRTLNILPGGLMLHSWILLKSPSDEVFQLFLFSQRKLISLHKQWQTIGIKYTPNNKSGQEMEHTTNDKERSSEFLPPSVFQSPAGIRPIIPP